MVYYPKSDVLETLLNSVVASVGLEGLESVENVTDIEKIVRDRKLIAGIVFDHSAVIPFLFTINFFQI